MQRSRGLVLGVLAALVVAQAAWIAYPCVRDLVFPPEETSAARGYRWRSRSAASRATVPAAAVACTTRQQGGRGAGVHRADADDVREERPTTSASTSSTARRSGGVTTRTTSRKMKKAGLHMPAYRGFISDAELEDLVAYLRATSGQILPDEKLAAQGRRARRRARLLLVPRAAGRRRRARTRARSRATSRASGATTSTSWCRTTTSCASGSRKATSTASSTIRSAACTSSASAPRCRRTGTTSRRRTSPRWWRT